MHLKTTYLCYVIYAQYVVFKSVFFSWRPSKNFGSPRLAGNAKEREGVIFVDTEAEISLGLSDSGSTFMRNLRPRKD